jgi:hypothetical protein
LFSGQQGATKDPVERVLKVDPTNGGVRLRRVLDLALETGVRHEFHDRIRPPLHKIANLEIFIFLEKSWAWLFMGQAQIPILFLLLTPLERIAGQLVGRQINPALKRPGWLRCGGGAGCYAVK